MQKRKFISILFGLILLLVAACSPQAVEEIANSLEETTEESTQGVLKPVEESNEESYPEPDAGDAAEESGEMVEGYPEPETEAVVEESDETAEEVADASADNETEDGLPKLPSLAQASGSAPAPAGPGVGGGAGVAESADAISVSSDVMGTSVLVDAISLFENTEFSLVADYPSHPATAQVIERIRSQMTADLAQQLAAQNGFASLLYQEQLPIDVLAGMEVNPDGSIKGLPFIAFSDAQQITLMDGSYWIDTRITDQTDLNFEQDARYPEDLIQKMAQDQVRGMNLGIDFVDIQVESFGNALVFPIVNGNRVNQPIMGMYFDFDTNGELFVRSTFMDLYGANNVVGEYPIISAEAAWENLKPGLDDGSVFWYLDSFPELILPVEPEGDIEQPLTWTAQQVTDGPTNIYGYPTVYNPVGDDSLPLIFMNGMWVTAPLDVAMLLSTSEPGIYKMTGSYTSEAGAAGFVAESATQIPFESQLFLQGVIVIEGDQVFVDSPDNGRLALKTPPAELTDGLEVFVDGFQDGATADGTPMLDWQYMSEVLEYGDELIISEPLPVDGTGFGGPALDSITIDAIEFGYGISWPQFSEELDVISPIQSNYLIPIWTFSGTTADGTEIRFEIPAVDQAYFQNS